MRLADFLFKNEAQKKLAHLIWGDELEASVREFSLMSGLGYATAYEELHHMEKLGLVKKSPQGRSTLYRSSLAKEDQSIFKKLITAKSETSEKKLSFGTGLLELGLPYTGSSDSLGRETVADLEELVVRAVEKTKKSAALARALPVLLAKLLPTQDKHRLLYWAKKYKVKKELGFFVDLTGLLTEDQQLKKLARFFYDNRWAKDDFLFENEKAAKGYRARLVTENTPKLAKRWFLKMNMGLDSFASNFMKFS
jgi:DNA-binding transcriptional ArsR family regulator